MNARRRREARRTIIFASVIVAMLVALFAWGWFTMPDSQWERFKLIYPVE